MAASPHGDTPDSGKAVTSGSATPYTTSVDVNKVLLNWDDKSTEAHINASSRSTSKVALTGWSKSVEVTADAEDIVLHAGLAPAAPAG